MTSQTEPRKRQRVGTPCLGTWLIQGSTVVMLWLCAAPAFGGAWASFWADPAITVRAYLGDAAAQNTLGRMYFRGTRVPQDDAEAVSWWRLSAERGNADAQTNLGAMFDQGRGVSEDDQEAIKWWRRAAEQGNPAAKSNLRAMAAYGRGVPENDAEALAWYREFARQGDEHAQYLLARRYAIGRGVAEDPVAALAWYGVAASNGSELAAEKVGELESRLTEDQIAAARALANRCRASSFEQCD